jgi:hypothetical protein
LPPSPYQMASNVMSGKAGAGAMALHPSLDHLKSIEGLRNLLYSDHLYTDEKVHRLWVGLFASGVIYGCNRAGVKDTLDQMVDVDFEAHARYEIWSRLECQGWKHGYTAEAMAERANVFRMFRKLVRVDRVKNLRPAEAKRLVSVLKTDGSVSRTQALGSGALADTTDDEDEF